MAEDTVGKRERLLGVCRGHPKVSLWVQGPRPCSYLGNQGIPEQSHATNHGNAVRLQPKDCPFGVALFVIPDGWNPPTSVRDGTSQSFCTSLLSTHLDFHGVFYDKGLSLEKERYMLTATL